MKRRLVLSPRAQNDLDAIWDFTAARWGMAQARRYSDGLWDAMTAVATGTKSGRTTSDMRGDYLRLPIGSHVVFYRARTDTVDVIRILHERMAPGDNL